MTIETLQQAYEHQRRLVEQRSDHRIGYKIAFSSAASQQAFGLSQPAFGILFETMRREPDDGLRMRDFVNLRLENEIGFIIDTEIAQPLRCIEDIKPYVRSVVPAIEAPDMHFGDPSHVRGYDIVAGNAIAAAFILGAPLDPKGVDLAKTTVTFFRDDAAIDAGAAANVLGSPWNALLWLTNELPHYGYALGPGDIVLTGAMGKMLPALPGTYCADFGTLGTITFVVRD